MKTLLKTLKVLSVVAIGLALGRLIHIESENVSKPFIFSEWLNIRTGPLTVALIATIVYAVCSSIKGPQPKVEDYVTVFNIDGRCFLEVSAPFGDNDRCQILSFGSIEFGIQRYQPFFDNILYGNHAMTVAAIGNIIRLNPQIIKIPTPREEATQWCKKFIKNHTWVEKIGEMALAVEVSPEILQYTIARVDHFAMFAYMTREQAYDKIRKDKQDL